MADPYVFQGKRVLVDVTVTQVVAGATHLTVTTGSSSSDPTGASKITTLGGSNAIVGTALSGNYGDLTELYVIPAIESDGSWPDIAIWPVVDGVDLGDIIMLDGSVGGNMMPLASQIVGNGFVRTLGVPFRQALAQAQKAAQNGAQYPNLALKATGLKAKQQYQFRVYSKSGFGNSATAQVALRIIGVGDKLDGQALQAVGASIAKYGYPGSFQHNAPGFNGIVGAHSIGGALSEANWTALPGGATQAGTKVNRFFRYAYNTSATTAQGRYVLSNQNSVQGVSGNVLDPNHDLGFDYSNSKDYLTVLEYGARAGTNQAFVGFTVGDTVLPDQPNGAPASVNVNPYVYGNVSPMRAATNEYFGLRATPWPVVAGGNKVAFFIQANGTAISANQASVAIGGVQVKQGN